MENLKTEELVEIIKNYINEKYEYEYADIFEDAITYHLENGKNIYINIEIDKEQENKQNEKIEKAYNLMKKYISQSDEKELEEHYNWYNVDNGDKEDLLNVMFESYCNSYDDDELEKRINDLFKD